MKYLLLLAALLPLALCDEGETCTQVIVTGDDVDAECTCTCVCEMDCPPEMTPMRETPMPPTTETPPPEPPTTEILTPEPPTTEPPTTEPPESGCCVAGQSGQDLLDTYDGNQFQFLTNNKFVVSDGGSGSDQCKFQVRIDTDNDENGQPFVSWCGIAFGVHKNPDKFERNFRVSLREPDVEIRGRGFKDPVPADPNISYDTGPNPEEWTFMYTIDEDGCFVIRGEVPAENCDFEVTYCERAGPAGNDVVKIRPPSRYIGMLTGMCGNFDGNPDDDDQHCPGLTNDISDNCIEGKHQGNDSRFP